MDENNVEEVGEIVSLNARVELDVEELEKRLELSTVTPDVCIVYWFDAT
jgi:hypothetical protein